MTSTTVPPTMRAWTHSTSGPPAKVLSLDPAFPTPVLKAPTDVLVRISHAALNPATGLVIQLVPSFIRAKPSCIPELDFSGTVVDVGAEVPSARELRTGVSVFGSVHMGAHITAGVGTLAEYIVVPAECVALKPGNVSLEKAAGFGVCGVSAMVLMDKADIQKGDRVLINGASGGVGSIAVQFAEESVGEEGEVVAICSGRNINMVKGLGAHEVIDYVANAPVHEYLATKYSKTPFDVIIDAYGVQDLFTHCPLYLKPGKPFVTVGVAAESYTLSNVLYAVGCMLRNMLWPRILGGVNRAYVQITAIPSLPALEKLAELAEEDCFDIPVDSSWKMGDALKAYERILSKRAQGKVIVQVRDS